MASLIFRSLRYYWRTNLAVVVGVATAVSVLAGALLVGDSVRGSLRDLVVRRLGRADRVVLSTGFFREAFAADLQADSAFKASFTGACPLIVMPGAVSDQETGQRSSRVQVYGVDDRFWRFHGVGGSGPAARDVFVSRALAAEIGASAGHSVLIRVERPSDIPIESLHGRKDAVGRALRLTVRSVIEAPAMGDFSLQPQQGDVRAIFVPLARLQTDLGVTNRVNALLVADAPSATSAESERTAALNAAIRRRFALEDVGLSVRSSTAGEFIADSAAGLIDAPRTRAIEGAAAAAGLTAKPVFTYLANTLKSGDREVPYSLVTATDLVGTWGPALAGPTSGTGGDPIVINDWTARALAAKVGDPMRLEYYVWQEPGQLITQTADFRVAAIVPIAGLAADRDLAPTYPGITEAKTLGDWDPPFPIDLRRIGRADEDYWDRYRTTPKAFISLETGQRLWRSRFGDTTSIRLTPPASGESDARDRFASALRGQIDPAAFGLMVQPVRAEGLRAAHGATDFGEYFTYFSFFLVASALLLAALFFRLTVEQRARETGLLRAVGFGPARLRRLFLAEGAVLAFIGAVVGVAGAVGYGALMMRGLRTWWSGAVGTTSLQLHVTATSLAAGAIGAAIAAVGCIWWTLRRLLRLSERSLLSGNVAQAFRPAIAGLEPRATFYPAVIAGVVSLIAAFALLGAGLWTSLDRTAAFFGSGTLLLVACLCGVAVILRRPPHSALAGSGWRAMARVGLRNASDRPGRSILAIGVIASATFLLVAVGAFRRDAPTAIDRHSGTGGYRTLVDLLLPLVNDPNGRDGREALGLTTGDSLHIEPFRVLPGDDASCLNLYEPTNPRILGVTPAFVSAGRFAFQSSLASSDAERTNPWLLLNRDLGSDVVPVIADANSMTYVLHKSLGDEITITVGERPIKLRLVAALGDSIFQRELLMTDADFVRLFPAQEGYRFLLVDGDVADTAIEQGAADLGADAENTAVRLAEFHTVENTYLATFQALGGLGLLVGTLGLAAVVLRNVLERRRELGLLGAVGYSRANIFLIVVAENLLLVAWGLAIGAVCAIVAIMPAALERGGRLPVNSGSAALVFAVFLAGLLSSAVATRAALGTPLLEALRSE